MKDIRLIKKIKTIGEDNEEYEVYLYQEFLTFDCMCNNHVNEELPGMKFAELANGKKVNKLSNDDEYDWQIVFPEIKLKKIN